DEAYRRNIELVKQFPRDNDEPAEKAKPLSSDSAEPIEKAKPIPRKEKASKPRGARVITATLGMIYAVSFIGIGAVLFIENVQMPKEIEGINNISIRTDYEECAEFEQRLEDITFYTDKDGQRHYHVTIGFTMKNIADDPVIFFPKLLDVYLDDDSSRAPVATEGTRDYDDGVFVVINDQKDFTVTYRLDRNEVSQINCFGYGLPYRYKIDIDNEIKEEIAAFLSDEEPEDIS
ncbi:MAG: hypothetical protein K2G87_11160, partial [Oscillospiraceae bacterium]|nr:hypothetical protein [Oscillospiraceae bacterium]